jgi:hypothetical protein
MNLTHIRNEKTLPETRKRYMEEHIQSYYRLTIALRERGATEPRPHRTKTWSTEDSKRSPILYSIDEADEMFEYGSPDIVHPTHLSKKIDGYLHNSGSSQESSSPPCWLTGNGSGIKNLGSRKQASLTCKRTWPQPLAETDWSNSDEYFQWILLKTVQDIIKPRLEWEHLAPSHNWDYPHVWRNFKL